MSASIFRSNFKQLTLRCQRSDVTMYYVWWKCNNDVTELKAVLMHNVVAHLSNKLLSRLIYLSNLLLGALRPQYLGHMMDIMARHQHCVLTYLLGGTNVAEAWLLACSYLPCLNPYYHVLRQWRLLSHLGTLSTNVGIAPATEPLRCRIGHWTGVWATIVAQRTQQ